MSPRLLEYNHLYVLSKYQVPNPVPPTSMPYKFAYDPWFERPPGTNQPTRFLRSVRCVCVNTDTLGTDPRPCLKGLGHGAQAEHHHFSQ